MDTSAIFALMDADDTNHNKAKKIWVDLIMNNPSIVVSNYILVESFALIQHRLGMQAVRLFQEDIVPILTIEWVDRTDHLSGVAAMLAASQKKLSLVDCVSFIVMRKSGVKDAFSFDRHFISEGFHCLT